MIPTPRLDSILHRLELLDIWLTRWVPWIILGVLVGGTLLKLSLLAYWRFCGC
jgi:hypothetical protein